jgi:signal transduction histidine kinase
MAHLLGLLGHDLRTPLTGLKGRLQLAQRRARRTGAEPADPQELNRMLALVERMNHQIAVLLDASQIQRRTLMLRAERTELDTVLRRALATVQTAFPDTPFSYEPSAATLLGEWDATRLRQGVLTALLTNAVRFGSEDAPVSVRARHAGAHARIEVEDEGIGVPHGEEHVIFEFGRRASNAEGFGGPGLGLFVAREIVTLHGGEIGVERARTRGVQFWFTLPLSAPVASAAAI